MIITIGRQLAAGGREVGALLAERLGLRYFDKELLQEAAKQSGITQDTFLRADENYNLFTLALNTDRQKLFQWQSETIRRLAAEGDCLFLGRAADYVLRDRSDIFSVFLTADLADRVTRIMEGENMQEKEALAFIENSDSRREDYYNFFTGKHWGDSSGYDLCINTSRFGITATADIIIAALRHREETVIN